MNDTNTGGPAFPCHTIAMYEGMTLRDYFAAKALTAIYQDYVDEQRNDAESVSLGAPYEPGVSAKCMARECYAIADAMLYVRNLKQGEI
jgi:hypothetical protein